MADITKWDDEYEEMVLEYLYGLDTEVLVYWLLGLMKDTDVDQLIDDLEKGRNEYE